MGMKVEKEYTAQRRCGSVCVPEAKFKIAHVENGDQHTWNTAAAARALLTVGILIVVEV